MLQKTYLLLCLIFLLFADSFAQKWEDKGIKQGVHGYACESNGDFWFKGIIHTNASLSACLALLRDEQAFPKWAADIVLAKHLKINEANMEYYTYGVLDFPWPLSNRDFILRGITTQDAKTKVIKVKSTNAANFIPSKLDYVRMKSYTLNITFAPVKNQTQIEMVFFMGKADNLPSWLLELFLSDKCYASIARFGAMSTQAPYNTAVIAGIRN